MVLKGMVLPIIEYGSVTYATASPSMKTEFDRLYHEGIRLAIGAVNSSRVADLENECGMQGLGERRINKVLAIGIEALRMNK